MIDQQVARRGRRTGAIDDGNRATAGVDVMPEISDPALGHNLQQPTHIGGGLVAAGVGEVGGVLYLVGAMSVS